MTGERTFLSAEACQALFHRLVNLTTGGGETSVTLVSQWAGTTKWLRNRVTRTADAQTLLLIVRRRVRGTEGFSTTTRSDDAGLREAVEAAERTRSYFTEQPRELVEPFVDEPMLHPELWSEPTFALSAAARCDLAQRMSAPAEAAGLFAAGTLTLAGQGYAMMRSDGLFRYYPVTAVACDTTVRDAAGTASGWAGITHHALDRIDPLALGARALDKARRSATPRAVEPGRYTVILEPQAVHDLCGPLIEKAMGRGDAEWLMTPFGGGSAESASKIGSAVVDTRLTLAADPMDPDAGFLPFDEQDGTPYRPVTWIERGVLKQLAYDKWYATHNLGEAAALPNAESFHLRGADGVPATSIEEMIASTERGLLVTRFHGVDVMDRRSMLCGGLTRDGLWLIERGKITTPVKNFRFTDSPMFALNGVDAIGPTARVYSPGYARVVPALKVRQFNFTSLADAV